MAGLSLKSFIETILINDLGRMTKDYGLHYLAFGSIAVGIEFLGACQDEEPFSKERLSRKRFNAGINDFMRRIDKRYYDFNQDGSPFNLYEQLRCGMSHVLRPQGTLKFCGKEAAEKDGYKHLEILPSNLGVLMTAEDFYDDFAKACHLLLADLPNKTSGKFAAIFLPVTDLPAKA